MPNAAFAYDLSTLNGVTFHYENMSYGQGRVDSGVNYQNDPRPGVELNVANTNVAAGMVEVEYINSLRLGNGKGSTSAIVDSVDQTYTAGFSRNGYDYLPTFGKVTIDITTDRSFVTNPGDSVGYGKTYAPFHELKTFYIHGFGDDNGSLLISDSADLGFKTFTGFDGRSGTTTHLEATPALVAAGKGYFGILSNSDLGAGPTSPAATTSFIDDNNIFHGPITYTGSRPNLTAPDHNPDPLTFPLHFTNDGSGYVAAPQNEPAKGFDLTDLNGVTFGAGSLAKTTNPASIVGTDPNNVTISYLDFSTGESGNAPRDLTVSHAVNYYHAAGTLQIYDGYDPVTYDPVYRDVAYLPTFGSIQLTNPADAAFNNDRTYWIHGFSENGLLISTNKMLTFENTGKFGVDSIENGNFFVLNNTDVRAGPNSGVFPLYAPRTGTSDFTGMFHKNVYAHGETTDPNGFKHTLTLYDRNGDGVIKNSIITTTDSGGNPVNTSNTEVYGSYEKSDSYGNVYSYEINYDKASQFFNLNNTAAPLTFPLTFTGAGENYVAPVCFAEGTRIETVAGPVAVEALVEGDLVVTAEGAPRAVTWIGRMVARPSRHPHPHEVNPVRVRAHAFGPGRPERDVRLSPGHAVHVDGVLVPIGHLVNGATIVQEAVEAIRYFHVELDSHDVLIAEGLPCESYLDDGNRDVFANAEGHAALHGRLDPQSWEHACAPLVADGPQLTALQQRLQHAAEALGWVRSEASGLRIVVDGVDVAPVRIAGNRMWFALPVTPDTVTLASNHSVLAQMMPGLPDFRRLGVAIAELRVDGVAIELADAAFGDGFYPVEHHEQHAWRWTDGAASLALPPSTDGASDGEGGGAMVELAVIMVAPSWVRPAPLLHAAEAA